MLEKMGEFFDARLDGYEEHQLKTIASAEEFYPFTAALMTADSSSGEGSFTPDSSPEAQGQPPVSR